MIGNTYLGKEEIKMNKMIDSRCCQNFRKKDVCSNQNQDLLNYLDNQVITPMSLTFEPEDFDKAFEYCASCEQFVPYAEFHGLDQITH
jgi:hypothetical protein